MTHDVLDHDPIAASEDERTALAAIEHLMDRVSPGHLVVAGADGENVALPASLYRILRRVVHHMVQGHIVTVVPMNRELRLADAAGILNVAEGYLHDLLDRGEIPVIHEGARRRIRFEDLMEYKKRRDAERRNQLRDLTQLSEELGLYDHDYNFLRPK